MTVPVRDPVRDQQSPSSVRALAALSRRLRVAAEVLVPAGAGLRTDAEAVDLLPQVVAAVRDAPSYDRVWLLLTAVSGRLAERRAVDDARAILPGCPVTEGVVWLLAWALHVTRPRDAERGLELLRGIAVDTGWQGPSGPARVAPWQLPAGVTATDVAWVTWWPGGAGLRPAPSLVGPGAGAPPSAADPEVLCAPWGCVVLLAPSAGYDEPTRRAYEAVLGSAPTVAVGYGAPSASAPLLDGRRSAAAGSAAGTVQRRSGDDADRGPRSTIAAQDVGGWQEAAVERWLVAALPATRPLSERATAFARRQVEGRAVAGPLRAVVVRARRGLRP